MSFYYEYVNNFIVLKSTLFRNAPLVHGFGTRLPRPPLDEDLSGGDEQGGIPDKISRQMCPNRWSAMGLRQIHSTRVWQVEKDNGSLLTIDAATGVPPDDWPPPGDALLSATTGLALFVRTADCVPVIFIDPVRRVTAVAHSGWRGTLEGISAKVVKHLGTRYGSRSHDLLVAAGPGIQACCYEISPELARQFEEKFPGSTHPLSATGTPALDLQGAIGQTLRGSGVPADHIDLCPLCTRCRPTLFHSYRRDGVAAGRLFSMAMLSQ